MRAPAERYTSEIAIVLVGNFNPIVFQPAWFANQKLLRSAETEKADVNIIHPDVVSFSSDWLSLQVTRERFTALTTSEPHKSHLRDFVAGTFTKLQHTPITQLGVNCTRSITFENELDWHDFGHYFAPKTPWGDDLKDPGMLQVSIRSNRPDQYAGEMNLSTHFAGNLKASIKINDHFDSPPNDKEGVSAAYFTGLIETEFSNSIERAVALSENIFKRFSETEKFDGSYPSKV